MRIDAINGCSCNKAFQSKLPKYRFAPDRSNARDYWADLAQLSIKLNKQNYFKSLLVKLTSNYDKNILALEREPANNTSKNSLGAYTYKFFLYKNSDDLADDRRSGFLGTRALSRDVSTTIEKTNSQNYDESVCGQLLNLLERILTPGDTCNTAIYGSRTNEKIQAEEFLAKFRSDK